MSAVSYHVQAAYDMQCALYRRWVRGERGPQIPPFDMMAVPFPADRTRIEADERPELAAPKTTAWSGTTGATGARRTRNRRVRVPTRMAGQRRTGHTMRNEREPDPDREYDAR